MLMWARKVYGRVLAATQQFNPSNWHANWQTLLSSIFTLGRSQQLLPRTHSEKCENIFVASNSDAERCHLYRINTIRNQNILYPIELEFWLNSPAQPRLLVVRGCFSCWMPKFVLLGRAHTHTRAHKLQQNSQFYDDKFSKSALPPANRLVTESFGAMHNFNNLRVVLFRISSEMRVLFLSAGTGEGGGGQKLFCVRGGGFISLASGSISRATRMALSQPRLAVSRSTRCMPWWLSTHIKVVLDRLHWKFRDFFHFVSVYALWAWCWMRARARS